MDKITPDDQIPVAGESLPEDSPATLVSPETDDDTPVVNYGDGLPPDLLWIKEGANRVLCTIYAYKEKDSNRLRTISLTIQTALRELGLIEYPIDSEWSIPTRADLESYRERASRSDGLRGQMVHRPTLQSLVIRHHLMELRLGPAGHVTKLPLARDSRGGLNKEAFKLLGQLHASVVDMLYLKFVDDAALLL